MASKITFDEIVNSQISLTDNILFSCANEFSYFIEHNASINQKTCTQMVLEYCDNRDIEPEEISRLISPSLKGKLQMEMVEMGLLPEHNTLF